MFGRSYRLPLKLLGIPVYVDLSFLIVLPLLAWIIGSQVGLFAKMFGIPMSAALTTGAMPYVLGLAAAAGLFISVVIHELGHAVVARGYGVVVRRITLWFLGGVAQFESIPRQRGAEAVVGVVGPVVSLVIGVICWQVLRVVPAEATAGRFILAYLAYMNIVLAVFNMLPALPLDGGRVLRSVLALWMPRRRATQVSSGISKFLAVLMGLFGLFSGDYFMLLIAVFIFFAVTAETRSGQIEDLLRGSLVRDLMNRDVHTVHPDLSIAELTHRMHQEHHMGFPVTDESGKVVGLVSLRDVHGRDPGTAVREIMHAQVPSLPEQAAAIDALKLLGTRGVDRVIATGGDGRMVGIITKTDLMRLIELRSAGLEHGHSDGHAGGTTSAGA